MLWLSRHNLSLTFHTADLMLLCDAQVKLFPHSGIMGLHMTLFVF